jgi:predicted transcriptional regulator
MAEKVKFSVSIDAELGTALREYAAAEDEQISAVISRALERYLDDRRLIRAGLRAMKDYEAEYGPFSEQETAEADAWAARLFEERTGEERRSA